MPVGEDAFYDLLHEDDTLRQGDIFLDCPLAQSKLILGGVSIGQEIASAVQLVDLVLMTNSCDLVTKPGRPQRVDSLQLCHHDAKEKQTKKTQDLFDEFAKGKRIRFSVLPATSLLPGFGDRLIDFSQVFTVPRVDLAERAKALDARLRLKRPFADQLAQRFGFFYMRIGLERELLEKL
jgi:hypothetical protein